MRRGIEFLTGDLAPGDGRAKGVDLREVLARPVRDAGDPLFDVAYRTLWDEFGAAGEVEQRDVLARRLRRSDERRFRDSGERRYEMIVIERAGQVVAVRDHQAMLGGSGVVVHLSHAWVHPDDRRSGLAGWLRALPLQMARACAAGRDLPVTLVAEMEHPIDTQPGRMIRLAAYEKAGFLKVDPRAFAYLQPDFRSPREIDTTGGSRPLPFALVLRRVGCERESHITGLELRQTVETLYRLYEPDFRPSEMKPVWEQLAEQAPADEAIIRLVPPTWIG